MGVYFLRPPIPVVERGSVVYNNITVIGLGTLGGFLCKNISELNLVKELTIIDYDTVEGKNVFKSIYSPEQIGEFKVDALSEIIRDDIVVTKIKRLYIEGITKIPKSDLVIDCRDIVCDRQREIDVRLYISGRNLIMDCRKNVQNKQSYDGEYSIILTKSEINKAAFFASQIIETGTIRRMISNQMVQKIELNLLNSIMNKSIQQTIDNKIDMIYEATGSSQRIHCITENINPIFDLNNAQDIEVFVGERTKTLEKNIIKFPKEAKNKHLILPKKSLKNSFDIINILSELVERQPGVSNFILTIREKEGIKYVELLEETGAA